MLTITARCFEISVPLMPRQIISDMQPGYPAGGEDVHLRREGFGASNEAMLTLTSCGKRSLTKTI
jgi:hypothetical protein